MNPLNAIATDNQTVQRMFREIAKYVLDGWKYEIMRIGKEFKVKFGLSIESLETQLQQLEGDGLKCDNIFNLVTESDCYKLVLQKSDEDRNKKGYKRNLARSNMERITRRLAKKMERLSLV